MSMTSSGTAYAGACVWCPLQSTDSAPVASWVGRLGGRSIPESIEALARGRECIHLVRIHEVGEPALVEDWLRAHGRVLHEGAYESASVAHFAPAGDATF